VKSAVKSTEPRKSIQAAMTAPQSTLDPAVLAQLACPACHGDLRQEDSRLICTACARRYPIVDGIPALTIERAETK
jgi:uncharacterized protein YbaR (Trm112 family)